MFFMSLFAFIVLLIFPPLSGLVDGTQFSYLAYIPVALLFALFTPFSALLVSSFAQNKVQAFAIFKIGGTVFMLPIFAFFLNLGNLKYIFSPIPNFWSIMSLDSVLQNGTLDIVHLGIGFAYHIALIGALFYIFNKKN
jgi:fluoroquinolone transport system permease protein